MQVMVGNDEPHRWCSG